MVKVNGTWEWWNMSYPFLPTLCGHCTRIFNSSQSPRVDTKGYRTLSVSPLLCPSRFPLIGTETEQGRCRGETIPLSAVSKTLDYWERHEKKHYEMNTWKAERRCSKMDSIFRCLLFYQHQGSVLVPVRPHPGRTYLILAPGQASDWLLCVTVHAPVYSWTWDMRQV